ncbi:transcriptional regulator WhiJ [Streptomyces glaucosporus]|uniref:Transcriptional regulator WhiJ n=2 Tax=Streptomyces glaucosporus TaxID=284044 RepID=A0ABP5UQZ9_9ACTN
MREAAGYNAREAAAVLGIDHTKISHMETARFGVSAERVRTLASAYKCDDEAYVEALAAMATDRTKGWWEEYRGILPSGYLDVTELEDKATYLRSFQVAHIPGLAQTEDYARAVFSFGLRPSLYKKEIEARTAHRTQRIRILERDNPPDVTALVHEAALRMRFGGRDVTRAQLKHLLELSEHPHFTVRVVPFDADGFAGSGSAVLYAGGAVQQLDTVHLDSTHGPIFLYAEAQLKSYRSLLSSMEKRSLSVRKSRDTIHEIMRQL